MNNTTNVDTTDAFLAQQSAASSSYTLGNFQEINESLQNQQDGTEAECLQQQATANPSQSH